MAKIKVPQVEGYDIVVWQDKVDSPTFCAAYTREGAEYLRQYNAAYEAREAFELPQTLPPQEFLTQAPKQMKIGGRMPGMKQINLMASDPLH